MNQKHCTKTKKPKKLYSKVYQNEPITIRFFIFVSEFKNEFCSPYWTYPQTYDELINQY